jgi:hypothetical protein
VDNQTGKEKAMQGTRRAIHIAYSVSRKHGLNYHARAYCEEYGFPGLPENHCFKSGAGIGNDSRSSATACKAAVAMLLRDRPDLTDCEVFEHGRKADCVVTAAPVISFPGRNWGMGIARAYAAI